MTWEGIITMLIAVGLIWGFFFICFIKLLKRNNQS